MKDTSAPPVVSVITPVYNDGRYLREALASLEAQRYAPFEVVIVDDGSTDAGTLAVLEQAAQRTGTRVIRTPNQGPATARNVAIEHARGQYIVPLDADDYLAPTFLEETVGLLDADPDLGIVYTWIGLVGHHRGTWETGGFSVPELLSHCTMHNTALYRRAVWADVGGYDARFVDSCEDWDFWLGAAARGWKARCIPRVLAYYARRSPTGRAVRAAGRGVSGNLMRTLVNKHRDLYAEHMEEAFVRLYEEYTSTLLALERVYRHPAISLGLRLRGLLRGERPA